MTDLAATAALPIEGRLPDLGGATARAVSSTFASKPFVPVVTKKVAIVHDKTTYGQGLADETKKAMNAALPVSHPVYSAGEKIGPNGTPLDCAAFWISAAPALDMISFLSLGVMFITS